MLSEEEEEDTRFTSPVLNKLFEEWARRCSICKSQDTRQRLIKHHHKKHHLNGTAIISYRSSPEWYSDGKGGWLCHTCRNREYLRRYNQENKERIRERLRRYRQKNRERRNERDRERYHNDEEYRARRLERRRRRYAEKKK
jgi:hypothetical protein